MPDEPDKLTERISKAEQSIRNRVNDPRLCYRLTRNHKAWNEVVSSLDAIGDTEYAFTAYLARFPEDTGSGYLFLYGVLQAFVIQQNVVRHLAEAVGTVGNFDDPRLREARRVRIEAAGHPTRKDRPGGPLVTSHQVGRVTIGQPGFMMVTSDETGGIRTEHVDLTRVISDQREAIAEMLESLDADLARGDREPHGPRDERLSALFHPTLGYCFEKLHDGIFNAHPLGAPSLEQIKELIAAFASALEKRGLAVDAYSGIRNWYDEIAQPISELEDVLRPAASSILRSSRSSHRT